MDKESLKNKVCARIDESREQIVGVGEAIMDEPELGFKEDNTATRVRSFFDEIGLEYRDGLAQNSTWVTGTVTGSSANETRGCLHRRRLQQRPSGRHACAECVLARLERCLHKVSCLVCIADLKNQIWHPPPRGRHR